MKENIVKNTWYLSNYSQQSLRKNERTLPKSKINKSKMTSKYIERERLNGNIIEKEDGVEVGTNAPP